MAIAINQLCNCAYVAASGDQHVYGYQIGSDGSLTPAPGSPYPTGSNPVSLALHRSQRFLYVVNHDSNDVWGYQINPSTGSLTVVPNSPFSTGSQPMTLATSTDFMYVNDATGVSAFQVNPTTGTLTAVQGSPFPDFGTALSTNAGGFGTAH